MVIGSSEVKNLSFVGSRNTYLGKGRGGGDEVRMGLIELHQFTRHGTVGEFGEVWPGTDNPTHTRQVEYPGVFGEEPTENVPTTL